MKKKSLASVLLFLATQLTEITTEQERESLRLQLAEAGISLTRLIAVANWLKDLTQEIVLQDSSQQAMRVFNEAECEKMQPAVRGCIAFLEQNQSLNATTREWLIEHAMDSSAEQISMHELQLFLSIILFQRYGQFNLVDNAKCLIISNSTVVH